MPETLWVIHNYEEDYRAGTEEECTKIIMKLMEAGELYLFPMTIREVRPPLIDDINWNGHAIALMENLDCDEKLCSEDGGPTINITGDQLREFCLPTLDLSDALWQLTGKEKVIIESKLHYLAAKRLEESIESSAKEEEERIERMRKEVAAWDETRKREPMGDY